MIYFLYLSLFSPKYVFLIIGIIDLKNISPHTSLAALGMDSMMILEIQRTLEREYEIYLTASAIRDLNFAKIFEMNNKLTDSNNIDESDAEEVIVGTKMFMQLFDEQISTEVTISLNTNPEEGREEVFFLPGIEGYGSVFNTLESKIKSPATCFQLAGNCELKTVEEMANSFLPVHSFITKSI